MENTDKERFRELRKRLPHRYAEILFRRYQRKKMKISKSLIFKVAYGERTNHYILNDLLQLADEREAVLKRFSKIEKRLKNSPKGFKELVLRSLKISG